MAFLTDDRDGTRVLVATGDLDLSNRADFAAAVDALDTGIRSIDMSGITYIDSTGLSVLLQLAAKYDLCLIAPSAHVISLLNRTGTMSMFNVS